MIKTVIVLAGTLLVSCEVTRRKYGPRSLKSLRQKYSDRSSRSAGQVRRQQLQNTLSDADVADNRRVHLQQNRKIRIAATSVGLAILGSTINPMFTAISLVGIFYVGKDAATGGYLLLRRKGVLGVDALSSIVKILLLLNSQILLCSIAVLIYALNRKLMFMVKDNSKRNVIDAFRQFPRRVFVLAKPDGASETVEIETDLDAIVVGDIVVVNPGELIPVDGVIVNGQAMVDQHRFNGESQPAEHGPGDQVYALTAVLSGRIAVQTQHTGESTTAAQIAQTLAQTVDFKTDMQLWAEALTDRTVLPTLLTGTMLVPWLGLNSVAALLHSHPKYKTTLTGSVSLLNTLNQASEWGILVKDGRTFALLNQVDTVVFDKTGTLTVEQPVVDRIYAWQGYDEEQILRLAAAAEHRQAHPIAQAIIAAAKERQLVIPAVEHPEYQLGLGLTVQYENDTLHVGSVRFLTEYSNTLDDELLAVQACCHEHGHTLIGVALGKTVIGAIELHAQIRPEACEVVSSLHKRGIKKIHIISGDHPAPTAYVASQLGIDSYFAQTLPEDKASLIRNLQAQGHVVCYVGDGINDAIALSQADVSISLSGASSVAMDSAQAILIDKTIKQLCPLFELAKLGDTKMKQSFAILVVPHAVSAVTALVIPNAFAISFGLTMLGLFGGVANAMRPMIMTDQTKKSDILQASSTI